MFDNDIYPTWIDDLPALHRSPGVYHQFGAVKTDLTMRPIAERLLVRFPAAAQHVDLRRYRAPSFFHASGSP